MPVGFVWGYAMPPPPCKDCGLSDLPRNQEGRCVWCQELANFIVGHTHSLSGPVTPVYKYSHRH